MKLKNFSRFITLSTLLLSLSVISNCDPEPPVDTNSPPVFETVTPPEGREGDLYILDIDASDPDEDVLTYSLTTAPTGMEIAPEDGMIVWTPERGTAGEHSVVVQVDDGKTTVDQEFTVSVIPAGEAPVVTIMNPSDGAVFDQGTTLALTVQALDPEEGDLSASVKWTSGSLELGVGASINVDLAVGTHTITASVTDSETLTASASATIEILAVTLPVDPATVATPLPATGVVDLKDSVSFLYTGSNPIQTGVDADIIDEKRVAVIRGTVLNKQNLPLTGVTVSVKGHPEFGQTLSRADGAFDLALNGGGFLTLEYKKNGHLPAQRTINVPWRDYVNADPVVMITLDGNVTTVDLSGGNLSMQTARGGVSKDEDGERQATVLFPTGTVATVTLPSGEERDLTSLNVRLTEYTVGENGPKTMPGSLPATSGYTYAVDLTVDEALALNGERVDFNKPLPLYVDNFLDFPVGEPVPAGYYDYKKASWVPSQNGLIIQILRIENDKAILDIDGSGADADAPALEALGITDEELTQLAALYSPGKTLWRTPITHFTPWDCNWPYGPPDDSEPPPNTPPETDDKDDVDPDDTDTECGCIIDAQNQSLGEVLSLVGSPFQLHYSSDRTPGGPGKFLSIPLSGNSVPSSLQRIELSLYVAGNQITKVYSPAPNLRHVFEWNGIDAYGRARSSAYAMATITYVYDAVYYAARNDFDSSFGSFGRTSSGGNSSGSSDRIKIGRDRTSRTVSVQKSWFKSVSSSTDHKRGTHTLLPEIAGLGGWSLTMHHAYDPVRRIFYDGNGKRRSARNSKYVVTTLGGTGTEDGSTADGVDARTAVIDSYYGGLAMDQAGNIYYSESNPDFSDDKVRMIDKNGIVTTFAGGGDDRSDNIDAKLARIPNAAGLAFGPDGSLYIAEYGGHKIRKVSPDGIITTVAGNGSYGFSGDGDDALFAKLKSPRAVAVDAQENIYIADTGNDRIRKVDSAGIITTLLEITDPLSLTIAPDGSLYIGSYADSIHRLSSEGILSQMAGTGQSGFSGDGDLAIYAKLSNPRMGHNTVKADGSFILADADNDAIRSVNSDQIMLSLAGRGESTKDGAAGLNAQLSRVMGLMRTPDDKIIFSTTHRVQALSSPFDSVSESELVIPSADGRTLHNFTAAGRHLSTVDALSGAVLYTFTYTSEGRLNSITDAYNRVTTIERDGSGIATSILAPDGQRTTLTVDANGHLKAVSNPAGESHTMDYSDTGLMTRYTDPMGNSNILEYDVFGRLVKDSDPLGGGWTLNRTDNFEDGGDSLEGGTVNGHTTTMTSGMGRMSSYRVESLATGERKQTSTGSDGTKTTTVFGTEGSRTITTPDGTVHNVEIGPDPRYGLSLPVPEKTVITTPGGLTNTILKERSLTLTDVNDKNSYTSFTETTTQNGRNSIRQYDTASVTWTQTSAAGRISTQTLDSIGRPIRNTVTGLAVANFVYNSDGRLSSRTLGDGASTRTSSMTYHSSGAAKGFLKTMSDPLNRQTSFTYDAAGRVSTKTLPDGRSIQLAYDKFGNLASMTTASNREHTFQYTSRNQKSVYGPPALSGISNPTTKYEYNLDKQLEQITRPDGKQLNYAYNSKGQLTQTVIPRGTYSYEYNSTSGLPTEITAPDSGTFTLTYDGGLPLSNTWSGTVKGSLTRVYNNDFVVAERRVNGSNAIAFGYDADFLLTQAGELKLTRNTENGLISGTVLNTLSTTRSYNAFAEISSYSAGNQLYETNYERNLVGHITRITETVQNGTTNYSYKYDPTGRLVEVADGTSTTTFAFDDNGNRTHVNGTAVADYDAQDRLTRYENNNYSYTAGGELSSRSNSSTGENTVYSYDVFSNLTQVTLPDSTQIEYVIDGQNRRIGKKVNGSLVQGFLYKDQLNPVAELDGNNNVVSRFVYGDKSNVPAYMTKGGNTYQIISDHLGSVRLVVDSATGSVTQRIDYDVWGNITNDTNPGFQPFGFSGGIYDQHTKLTRFGARDYDAEIGRWTTKDPIGFQGGSMGLYTYVDNNPLNFIDPTGFCLSPAAIGALSGAMGGLVSGAVLGFLTGGPMGLIVGGLAGAISGSLSAGSQGEAGVNGAVGGVIGSKGKASGTFGSSLGSSITHELSGSGPVASNTAGGLVGGAATALMAGTALAPAALAGAAGGLASGITNSLLTSNQKCEDCP